jgi:hypothetical protein
MKVRLRAVTTVLSTAALVTGVLFGVANPASAAITLPWGADANELGQIHFYAADGSEVRGGSLTADPFAAYAVASTDDPHTENTAATLYAYTPVNGVLPVNWTGEPLTGTTAFPVTAASAPAVVKNAGAHRPAVTLKTIEQGNNNLAIYTSDVPNNDTTTAYAGLYELRIKTAGNDPKYWAAVIQVNSGAGTWSVVYPDATVMKHNTGLTIGKAVTINYGSATTLSTKLTDSVTHGALAGKSVKLYRKAPSAANWTFVTTRTTNSSGLASSSQKPTAKAQYRWQFAGDTSFNASNSAAETVSVRQVIHASSSRGTVPHNVTFKIYGTVSPASSGQKVTLQRQAGTKWNSIGTATIKKQRMPNGKTLVGFLFSVKQASKGTYKYRVTKGATSTLLAGTSNTLTVKVT